MKLYSIVLSLLALGLVLTAGIGYSMWAERLRVNTSIHIASGDDPVIGSYKGFICCEQASCCDHDHCNGSCSNCSSLGDNNAGLNDIGLNCHHYHNETECDCKGLEDDQMRLIDNSRTLVLSNLQCGEEDHHCCHDNKDNVGVEGNTSITCNHCYTHTYNMTLWVGLVVEHEGVVPMRLNSVSLIVNGGYDSVNYNYYVYGPFKTSFQQVWGHVDPCSLPFTGYSSSVILGDGEKAVIWIRIEIANTTNITSITITPVFENWNQ